MAETAQEIIWRLEQGEMKQRARAEAAESALAEYRRRLAEELDARADDLNRLQREADFEARHITARLCQGRAKGIREAAALVRERQQ